ELGRHLFWEKKLSRNNAVSCGSCHFPTAAFSDNIPKSIGLYGDMTRRNSMALVNMAWNTSFFWDGRSRTLEEQLLEPVENPIEMDLIWKEAVERIASDSTYQDMFTAAFGTPCVDSVRITYAMAQFIRTMVSANSEFDQAQYGPGQLSISEQNGLFLFLAEGGDPDVFPGGQNGGDCFHCHGGGLVLFTDQQFHNNGLDSVFTDLGRAEVNGSPFSEGQFKTPTLRNIALTAPYMHDGRFQTLEEVIEHYNSGGHLSQTIDPLMKFQGVGLGLSEQDIDDLVAFLETLTDEEFVNNPDFQDPH
ncbi:MAG: cytochrome c peroxidase, partial [Cryomorphaceae bacterium]